MSKGSQEGAGRRAKVEIGPGVGHSRPFEMPSAGLAQLAEQLICNQQVIGSSPIAGSKAEKKERIP